MKFIMFIKHSSSNYVSWPSSVTLNPTGGAEFDQTVLRNTSSYVYLFHSWTTINSEFGKNIMFPNTPYTLPTITMIEERLHGLALMYAHKDIKVYVEECVDLFE